MSSDNVDEPVFSKRESKAWQEGKDVKRSPRPTLNKRETIEFVELVSQLRTPATFQRKLGLSAGDVESYKSELGIDSQDEARVMLRTMRAEAQRAAEVAGLREVQKAREAEELANQRLEELERERAKRKPVPVVDMIAIQDEDVARQRRLEAAEEAQIIEDTSWELPLDGTEEQRQEQINQFRKDVQYRGIKFCLNKYGIESKALKAEAHRLGLKIQWDRVKR